MRISTGAIGILLAASALSGCTAHYQDASNEPQTKPLVGLSCTTRVELIEHSVVAYGETKRDGISFFSLTPRPGFSGPEVLGRRLIPAGHQIRVLSVRKCINCLTSDAGRLDLEVQIDDVEPSLPTYLGGFFADVEVLLMGKDAYAFNPQICELTTG